MEAAAAALRSGTCLEAEVCIVGAGPAGLVLAGALARAGRRVVVLESGGRGLEQELQALNAGDVVGDPYGDLSTARHRQLGGTVRLWNTQVGGRPGAKYVPLDRIDLDTRSALVGRPWPFGLDVLEPWYRCAHALCGLGPFAYDAASWADASHAPLPLRGGLLESRVYQLGRADVFVEGAVGRAARSSGVQLVTHATAAALAPAAGGERVESVIARRLDGGELRVRAGCFVLAAGAIENARLLLLSAAASPHAGFDPYGQVGRGFMEHPRDRTLRLLPARPGFVRGAVFYEAHAAAGGTFVVGRLALRPDALRAHGLANASVSLLPATGPAPGSARRLLRRLGLARAPDAAAPSSREPIPLLLNLEQRPHPENRVALATTRDALGLPRAELRWRWRPEEQGALERLHGLVADEFEASGLGTVARTPGLAVDPRAHHHAGTTPMSLDPREGVVDGDGRVHGLENVFAAGASVFPTAGFANPMLTIVALALRLSEHLGAAAR